jgi:hypothetical protein
MALKTLTPSDKTGYIVRSAGDVDGNGFNDLLVVSSGVKSDIGVSIGSLYVITNMYDSDTSSPTAAPNNLPKPTLNPSPVPSRKPSHVPSIRPTHTPTFCPSVQPTVKHTSHMPTSIITGNDTFYPTGYPSLRPSKLPSLKPSRTPTIMPSWKPTNMPLQQTSEPSESPSIIPSIINYPSLSPSSSSLIPTSEPVMPTNVSTLTSDSGIITKTTKILGLSFSSLVIVILSTIIFIYLRKHMKKKMQVHAAAEKVIANAKNILSPLARKEQVYAYFAQFRNITLDIYQKEVTNQLFEGDVKLNAINQLRDTSQNLINAIAYYKMCVLLTDPDATIRDMSYAALIALTVSHSHVVTEESVEILYLTLSHLFDDSKTYAVRLLKEVFRQHPQLITAQIILKLKTSTKNCDNMEFCNAVFDALSIMNIPDSDSDIFSRNKHVDVGDFVVNYSDDESDETDSSEPKCIEITSSSEMIDKVDDCTCNEDLLVNDNVDKCQDTFVNILQGSDLSAATSTVDLGNSKGRIEVDFFGSESKDSRVLRTMKAMLIQCNQENFSEDDDFCVESPERREVLSSS